MIRVVGREKRVAITRLFPHNKVDGLTWRGAGVYTSSGRRGDLGITAFGGLRGGAARDGRAGQGDEEGRCLRNS